jgi:hypothetical protein
VNLLLMFGALVLAVAEYRVAALALTVATLVLSAIGELVSAGSKAEG